MKNINSEKINRILIRSANWVGDAVMSIPMIRAIRGNFPKAEIFILAKPWVAPVFENSPDIDHILIYDAAGKHGGIWGVVRLSKWLRRYDFDLAVLVQNAFEAALISFLAGIPKRLGYNTDARTLLLTHPVSMKPEHKKRHHIDYYLGILEGVSLHTSGSRLSMSISLDERKKSAEILKKMGAASTDGIIGINPGAAYGSAKRWFPERYAQLCIRLKSLYKNIPIVVFGGPGEEKLGEDICSAAEKGCINLCGKTSLREAIAVIEKCRIFITNDSGLMHVAAALNIPQAAVFGPTNRSTTSPAGSNSRMIYVPVPCSPCLKQECPLGHHECMKAVTVDKVFEIIRNDPVFSKI